MITLSQTKNDNLNRMTIKTSDFFKLMEPLEYDNHTQLITITLSGFHCNNVGFLKPIKSVRIDLKCSTDDLDSV